MMIILVLVLAALSLWLWLERCRLRVIEADRDAMLAILSAHDMTERETGE